MQWYSLPLSPVDQQQRQLAVRVYSIRYTVRSGVNVLAKDYRLAMNGVNSNVQPAIKRNVILKS